MADDSTPDYLGGMIPADSNAPQTVPHAEDVAPLLTQRGLTITGMGRTPGQNAAVHGTKNSPHLYSEGDRAVDIHASPGLTAAQIQQHANDLGLPNAKVIYEGPGAANSTAPHFHLQWGTPDAVVAPPTSQATPDYLTGLLPPDAAAPAVTPTPQHAGWRSNGTSVEWFDPANPSAKAPAPTAPPGVAGTAIDMARSVPGGIAQGAAGILGMPGDAMSLIRAGARSVGNAVSPGLGTAISSIPSNLQPPTSADINSAFSAPTGGYYQPQTTAGDYTQTAASFLPAVFGGEGSIAARLLKNVIAPAIGSETAGQMTAGTSLEPYARVAGALGGGGTAALAGGVPRGAASLIGPLTSAGRNAKSSQIALNILHDFAGGPLNAGNAAEVVPGSLPTLSAATGSGGVANLERALAQLNPHSPLVTREAENSSARSAFFDQIKGTPQEKENAAATLSAATTARLKDLFSPANADRADISPVRNAIQSILDGPFGNRPDVKKAMEDVQGTLERNGKTITDPETLYHSVRDNIDNLISGKDVSKAYGRQAQRQLLQVKDALDDSIESGAPGFKQYLADYGRAAAPITSMEFLQGLNLTNATGDITLQKVQSALRDLDAKIAARGINQGKNVTTIQRDAVAAIRDDLLRQANIRKGLPINSTTVQNTINQQRLGLASHVSPNTLRSAGAGAGALLGGMHSLEGAGVGGVVGERLGGFIGKRMPDVNALMRASIQHNLEQMVLNPGDYAVARDAAAQNAYPGAIDLLKRGLTGYVAPAAVLGPNRGRRQSR